MTKDLTKNQLSRRSLFALGAVLSAGCALVACGSETKGSSSSSKSKSTLRFANAASVSSLDVAKSGTLETARISAQVLEPLVRANVNTGEPESSLATEWTVSEDSLTYTFTLREKVSFHNGEALTTDAVIKNIERWKKAAEDQNSNARIAYLQLFGTFNSADGATPLVTDFSAQDQQVRLTLSRPSVSFIKALTQPAFGIAAPGSLGDDGFFTDLPQGTGAYRLDSQEEDRITLSAFDGYWGNSPTIDSIVFSAIPSPAKRYYALLNDEIDVYDLVGMDNYVRLAKAGNLIQPRDPYAMTYISFNLNNELLKDSRIRQAIAHALNRGDVVRDLYPQGSKVADDFLPSLFMMKEESAGSAYSRNLEKAKELIKESGYKDQELEFYYPTDVSLAALPQPEALYASFAADLVEVGFNIVPKPVKWSEGYLDVISAPSDSRALALTGFIGSYRDPNAFYTQVLASTAEQVKTSSQASTPSASSSQDAATQPSPSASATSSAEEKAVSYEQVLAEIRKADQLTETEARREAYKKISALVAQLMPAIPIAYPVSSVALGKAVSYYPLSATGICNFSDIVLR